MLTPEGIWFENHGQINDAKKFYDKAIFFNPENDLTKERRDKLEYSQMYQHT
ncbi:MAG: hypothetical protein OEM28_02770 [Nitrosopumilus sp.]|nr:hypothetical protein [Nitrosopumilus sp.]MDH3487032.1 hypothetical protein [Nitrosopumilus sp.]